MVLLAASPIYYQIPLYRRLATDPHLDFKVVYVSTAGVRPYDGGYGKPIKWDVDLLGGYEHEFLKRATLNSIGDAGFLGFRDFDVLDALRRLQPDVLWIFGYAYLTHQMAAWWQRSRRRPLLVREEQTLIHTRSLWKQSVKRLVLGALMRGQKGLYIGTQNRRWFESYGIKSNDLYFTPYAVDNEALSAQAGELRPMKANLREAFDIADDAGPIILFVGRLVPKKQPGVLIDAFKRVRSQSRCTLIFVGSGPLERELREKVSKSGIPDVHFKGFMNQTEISRAYATADIFVLPSAEDETWGVVVNEAMNFHLPIVVSDKVGSAVDLVEEGDNGFVFPSHSLDELSDRLRSLVGSPALREAMGRRSSERIRHFSYDVAAENAITAIEAAVGPENWQRALD